jgi:hypothetical protein
MTRRLLSSPPPRVPTPPAMCSLVVVGDESDDFFIN